MLHNTATPQKVSSPNPPPEITTDVLFKHVPLHLSLIPLLESLQRRNESFPLICIRPRQMSSDERLHVRALLVQLIKVPLLLPARIYPAASPNTLLSCSSLASS